MAHTLRSEMYTYFENTEVIKTHDANKAYLMVRELADNCRAAAKIDILRREQLDVEAAATLWNAKEYIHLKIERIVKDEPFLLQYLIEYSKGYFEDQGCNR